MLKSLLWITALGLVAGLPVNQALADDAYVCDGGRLVYARLETLEKLKETDPCIAMYHKGETARGAPPSAQLTPTTAAIASPPPTNATTKMKTPFAKPLNAPATKDASHQPLPNVVANKVPVRSSVADTLRNVRIINAPQ